MFRWKREIPYEEAIANEPHESFVVIDGQKIHAVDSGEGTALVMLHGFASSAHSFRFLREPLSDNHRLIAVDLNGFGLTQRPHKTKDYYIEEQSDLIVQVLAEKGIEQFCLMGHSYGAVVSSCIAERHPEKVLKVILVSPPEEFSGEVPWYLRGKLGTRLAILILQLLLSNSERFHQLSSRAVYQNESLTREVSDFYRRSMLVEGFRNACVGIMESFGKHRTSMIRYEAIEQPVLIISGEQDALVSPENIAAVGEMIPQASVVTLSQCGHCPPEEKPDSVIEATLQFLAS